MFNAEYPMVRWLEANGYNVSYSAGVDTDRRGASIPRAQESFLSVGHDEYWSGAQRTNVESGAQRRRAPGVLQRQRSVLEDALGEQHLDAGAPPIGRWSPTRRRTPTPRSIPPARTSGPAPGATRASVPPADGGRPENALTGTIFTVNCWHRRRSGSGGRRQDALLAEHDGREPRRPAPSPRCRTARSATSGTRIVDNGFRPAGLIRLSRHHGQPASTTCRTTVRPTGPARPTTR